MPATRKLKVFRTSIGFHDAYVAAPSRKAALEAWGAATDLFAIGSAEQVTDPKLMKAALARPGEVLKLSRGTADQHLKAARKERKPQKIDGREKTASSQSSTSRRSPPPRPSRTQLDKAEKALEQFEGVVDEQLGALHQREVAMARERAALEGRLDSERARLRERVDKARRRHEDALARWREES